MGTQESRGRRAISPRRQGKQGESTARPGEPAPPILRPFEPGRAEPPVAITDDLEQDVAPPLPGKAHPPLEMDEVKPSLEDESRLHRHRPRDVGTTRFGFHPEAADAAADLAGELGSTFLAGATRGENLSELDMELQDREDSEVPFLIEADDDEEEEASAAPAPPRARRR